MNSAVGYKGFVTFLILLGIILTATLSLSYVIEPDSTTSSASESKVEPLELRISDISFDEATLSWITQDKTTATVLYDTDWSRCERDNAACLSQTINIESTSHNIAITGLNSDTEYYVKVKSGEQLFPEGKPLSFRTLPQSQSGIIAPVEIVTVEEEDIADFEGIENPKDAEDIKSTSDTSQLQVLGIETNYQEPIDPLSGINNLVIDEFRDALIYDDIRYDFNGDGGVTSKDYPLFLEFILNQED